MLTTAVFASEGDSYDTGTALDKAFDPVFDNTLPLVHTLRPKNCPCKCMNAHNARRQCRKFGLFCTLSSCTRSRGVRGQRCCQKAVGGFGRCECLPRRYTLAVSFQSELAARVLVADLCAIKKSCPPNCNCHGCAVFNVLCTSFKAPGGHRGWACSADCKGGVTTCRRIPGKR